MAKQVVGQAKFQVPGGQATPAPPVGTSLGRFGINLGQFVQQFNDRTREAARDASLRARVAALRGMLAYEDRRYGDPEAMANVRGIYGDRIAYAAGPYDALDGADCLAIVTEWGDFRRPDFDEMARRMTSRTIFDGRNLYAPAEMQSRGFAYHAIGKAAVRGG
jgi:hypothetical protein